MKKPIWVSKRIVLTIHERQIQEHGSSYGLRDEGLLEAALARPQNLYHYEKCNFFGLASAYGIGIIKNHPFLDGNKRVGITTTGIFLLLNNLQINAPEPELLVITQDLANGNLNELEFSYWLEISTNKISAD